MRLTMRSAKLKLAMKKLNGDLMSLLGLMQTARITRRFPKDATTVINTVHELVAKNRYVGAVVFSHGSSPKRDISDKYQRL